MFKVNEKKASLSMCKENLKFLIFGQYDVKNVECQPVTPLFMFF